MQLGSRAGRICAEPSGSDGRGLDWGSFLLEGLLHPGIFVRGGGSMPDSQKVAWTFFFSQLILQFNTEGVQWFYYRENYTFQGSRGVQLFPGGSKCLFL